MIELSHSLGTQSTPFSWSFSLPLTVSVLSEPVTELGPAVAIHTVRITLAVMLLHGTPGVSLAAGSEILAVSGQVGSDVSVGEARPRKTRWLVGCGFL